PLRGHQLGYRPKTNSYDAWDLPQWEQYFRDLAVFGSNAVELIPPRSDDAADSPHFPRPPLEMMAGMSRLLDDYGLDVWIWYPAMDKDYADPATVDFALKEWGEVFLALPRIDAVFGPQVRISLPQLRKAVPAKYPIRRYPDITHSVQCQYPVPDWDVALALTLARECINPRPLGEAAVFRAYQNEAVGFLTYSE